MLGAMRKRADSILLKGLFVVIILVFIFWGVGTTRTDRKQIAAQVNDAIISRGEFDQALKNLERMYRQMAPQSSPPAELLRTQAIDQLISTELLLQEASHLGLAVDETELRDSIAAMPQFQADGRFDKNAYLEILRMNTLKPSDFEELQRRQLLVDKIQEIIRQGVQVSPQELKDRFRFDNERVDLKIVRVPAATFVDQVTLSDADLQSYYAENAERYREPERVRVQLAEYRPQDFTAQVAPGEAEVQVYYDAHRDEYAKPEEVHARHILFRLAPDAGEAEKAAAREKAEAVLVTAKGGADFAALAQQHSQDATAERGGDLGSFGRGVMAPPFEAAAFALAPGQVSEIVETQFGLHIIKLEDKTPASQQPLEEVKGSIIEALKTQQARKLAMERVEAAHERILDGESLEAVVTDAGVTLQTPAAFAEHEPIPGLGERAELVKEAFGTEAGQVGEIVNEPTGYTIVSVVERIPSAVPPFDQVRGRVETDLRTKKAGELAKQRAEALLAQLKQTKDLEGLAQQQALTVEESKQIGRAGPYVPGVGTAPALKDAAFALTPEAPVAAAVYDVNGDAVIAVLAQRIPADESRFDAEQPGLATRLRAQAEAAAMRTFIEQLKSRARIEYGPAAGATLAPA